MMKRTIAEMKISILDDYDLMMAKAIEQEEEMETEEMKKAPSEQIKKRKRLFSHHQNIL